MPTNEFPENVESIKKPSVHHDEHGLAKPTPHAQPKTDAENPGYEVTDVNTKGIVVFLAGLMVFIFMFFILSYVMGKAINYGILKQDDEEGRRGTLANGSPAGFQKKGDNLSSNPEMEQRAAQQVIANFPTPRLDADDSNQSTADLHAREDLLLDHYTEADPSEGAPGLIHIPIARAMELVVKRGLPQHGAQNSGAGTGGGPQTGQSAPASGQTAASAPGKLTGDRESTIHAPLTNGFARTAYELEQMESREQKMKLEGETKAEKK